MNADAAPPDDAPDPVVPTAPAKQSVSGTHAIVWVTDIKAKLGIRSVFVTRSATGAKVLAERKEPVFAGSKELWVLEFKRLASKVCAECERCNDDPPTCSKNDSVDLREPYLKSLTGKHTLEPWSGSFSARGGCADSVGDHGVELQLEGGVGSVFFFSIHAWDQFCGGVHPTFGDQALSFDLDTGQPVTLSFPQAPMPLLRKQARTELLGSCASEPDEEPAAYRATAAYGESGELHGVYELTMTEPYACGTGPGHYSVVSVQTSDWIPSELERWGKLPGWVADYLAKTGASYAFMIAPQRASSVRRQLTR
jgi:hypothetical protein